MNKTTPINVFLVEDNQVFTVALKAEIETAFPNKPIKINSFETGEECMLKFREIKPDVVVIDFHLNSKISGAADGIKIMDWIKQENQETNVIMLSSEDNIDIALKSLKHGACDYVVKSETKFRKINYSLMHLFKLMEAKGEAKRYRNLVVGLSICILLLIGAAVAIQLFSPFLFQ
jgi:two-component system OmpR family response regulator